MTQGVISYYSFTGLCIWKIFLTVATVKDAKSSPHKLNSLRPRGAIPTNLRSYESPVKTKPWSILFESGLAEVTKSVVYQLIIKKLNSNETTKKLCWDAGSWDRKLALFFFFLSLVYIFPDPGVIPENLTSCLWYTYFDTLTLRVLSGLPVGAMPVHSCFSTSSARLKHAKSFLWCIPVQSRWSKQWEREW